MNNKYYVSKSEYGDSVARHVAWQKIKTYVEFSSVVGITERRAQHWSPMVDGLNEGEMENPYELADVIRGHNPPE